MGILGNLAGRRAVAEHRKKNIPQALRLYQEALQKGMNQPVLLRNYSMLLIHEGRFEKAQEVLRFADRVSKLTPADRSDLTNQYAIVLWKVGKLTESVELLTQQMSKGKTAALYSILGALLIETGDATRAERFNREALEYDESDPVFLDNMGQTMYRLFHDVPSAKGYFERAVQHKPGAIDPNYFLGLIGMEEGRWEEARHHLQVASQGHFGPLNYATPERISTAWTEVEEHAHSND